MGALPSLRHEAAAQPGILTVGGVSGLSFTQTADAMDAWSRLMLGGALLILLILAFSVQLLV